MRFVADYSETLEVFSDADRWNKRPSLSFSVSCLWDGFLGQNQSPRLYEITAHSSISNLRVTMQ
jgi:hypothetical protein